MNKWLQRTVSTASIACGIVLAASGVAAAEGDKPVSLGGPLGSVDSLPPLPDVTDSLTNGKAPEAGELDGPIPTAAHNPGASVGKLENQVGLSADHFGSKPLGSGPVGGTRGDISQPPAHGMPLSERLSAIGQLGSVVPLGNSPLGVGQPDDN